MNNVEAPLQFAGVHLQPYNALVRPGQVWKISKYFLRRWTPYMPASHVWLVIGARQESYFNGNRPWFTAYDQNLANAAGIHVRSFRRAAKREIVEGGGPLSAFISKDGDPAYVTGQPVPKQEETRYHVRLDDPLTPADAEALAYWLRRQAPQHVTPGSVRDLLTAAREQAGRSFYASEIDLQAGLSQLLTVADVVAHVFPAVAGNASWREAADRLHTHIVEPHLCHLETQYLRRQWLPELGPGPLLLLVYLRSLCYHNAQTGETRDQVQLLSGELEELFQKSAVTLRAWLAQLDEMLGESHPHGPFIAVAESNKRADQKVATVYRLNLLTPLHPDEFDAYHSLLSGRLPEAAEGVTQVLSATPDEGKQSFVSHVQGGDANNGSHVGGGQERNVSDVDRGEQSFVSGSEKKWQPYKYYKALFDAFGITDSTQIEEITQQQQHAWKVDNGEALQSFAAAAVGSLDGLLDHFGIYGKTRQKILMGPLFLEEIMAWYLYAEREPGLDYAERYMMKQAAAGQRPPAQFVQLAQLSWEQWRVFAVVWWLQEWIETDVVDRFSRVPLFVIWGDVYGEVGRAGLPFGVGEGLDRLNGAVEARGEGEPIVGEHSAVIGEELPCTVPYTAEDQRLWEETLQELSLQMTRATFDRWLRDSVMLERNGDGPVIGLTSAAKDWVENRLHGLIESTTLLGAPSRANFHPLRDRKSHV